MKKTFRFLFPLLTLGVFAGVIYLTLPWISPVIADTQASTCPGGTPSGCTVFTVSKGERVFFGGNDDYKNPDSY